MYSYSNTQYNRYAHPTLASLFHFADYTLVKSGNTCNRITTKEECEYAAVVLGASDTTVEEGYYVTDPPYCFLEGDGTLGGTDLFFNPLTTSTDSCSNDDMCVCKTSGNLDIHFIEMFICKGWHI